MKNDMAGDCQNMFLFKIMFLTTNFNFIGSRTIAPNKIAPPPPPPPPPPNHKICTKSNFLAEYY